MSDRYYNVDVNREMLREYLDITHTPKTEHGAEVIRARKMEIRAHIFTEAFSKFAAEYAPTEPELEIV